jgi:K+-transporting ATPase ATPase C chain
MLKELRSAVLLFMALSLVTGVAYPLLITAIAQLFFPERANGSLMVRKGKVVGSALIGQSFDDPKYFWGRPSATSPAAYTSFDSASGTGSAGSNLAPTNPQQNRAVQLRIASLQKSQPDPAGPIPIELVTASASGLDPQISPAAAEYQVARIAKVRGLPITTIRELVAANTEGRTWGVLGEPRVNLLKLNLALDALAVQ